MNIFGGKGYEQNNNKGHIYNGDKFNFYSVKAQEPSFEVLDEHFFQKAARNRRRSKIINLKTADWLLILQKDYIERDQQSNLLEIAQELAKIPDISWLLIRGEHGAGKTALLLWLAHELFCQGHRVVYKKRGQDLGLDWLEQLGEFSEQTGEQHFYVIIDDLFQYEHLLDGLDRVEFPFPCTLIGTTRLNEDQQDRLVGHGQIKFLNLNRNSETEKKLVIEKVYQDEAAEAKFKGMTPEKRQELMDSPNMLVLMLQLSEGKVFNNIIADFIMDLSDTDQEPIYQAFGIVCSFFQYGAVVPIEVLKLCLPKGDFSEKFILKKLEGLVEITTVAAKTQILTTIHELIAKTAMQVKYDPTYKKNKKENRPYSFIENPSLFERNLRLAIENLDVNQEIQRRWIRNSLRIFASRVSCDINLIRKIIIEYQTKIDALREGSSITAWTSWGNMYFKVGLFDEYNYCIHQVLTTKPQNFIESNFWLGRVKNLNDIEEIKKIANQVKAWLINEPKSYNILYAYLGLIEHFSNFENVENIFGNLQNIITETEEWLKNNPQYCEIRSRYLALVKYHCTSSEKLKVVVETTDWLKKHSESYQPFNQDIAVVEQKVSSIRGLNSKKRRLAKKAAKKVYKTKQADRLLLDCIESDSAYNQYSVLIERYFQLIESFDISENQFSEIFQTGSWIQAYLNKAHLYILYIGLIEKYNIEKQVEEMTAQTKDWLELHPHDNFVRVKYLGLIEKKPGQMQEAIAQTKDWLELHPDDTSVRVKYLVLIRKISEEAEEIRAAVEEQWQWLKQKQKASQDIWEAFLPIIYHHHAQPELIQEAIYCALRLHPENMNIIIIVFGYFRNYLNYETCYSLAEKIAQSKLPIDKWRNYIDAANVFRDYGKLDIAEERYNKTIKAITRHINNNRHNSKIKTLQDTIHFAFLSQASLFLLKEPPDWYSAIGKLNIYLKRNPESAVAFWLMALSNKAKGKQYYRQTIDFFNKAIKFDEVKHGFFLWELGCFYWYELGNMAKARKCFEDSLNQKVNLKACVDLAELEIKAGYLSKAKAVLKNGLKLVPITRPEKEERENLNQRIQALQKYLK